MATVTAVVTLTGAESVTAVDAAGASSDHRLSPPRNYALLRGRYDLGDGSFLAGTATAVDRLDGELHLASANHDAYTQSLVKAAPSVAAVRLRPEAFRPAPRLESVTPDAEPAGDDALHE